MDPDAGPDAASRSPTRCRRTPTKRPASSWRSCTAGWRNRFGDGLLLGLRPVAPSGDRFDEDRVGLDHVAFAVAGRAELEDAMRLLDRLGVPHEGITETGRALLLAFRDPDNVALELYSVKPAP